MQESLLKCKCDAMHDDLKSFKQNQPKNFVKNSSILKNSKFFKKSQKLGQKNEMHDKMSENEIIPKEEDDL